MTGYLQRHLEAWRSDLGIWPSDLGFESRPLSGHERRIVEEHIAAHEEYARQYTERLMIHYPTESEETPMPTDPSTLRREAAALLAEADRLESRPKDNYAEGTVLTFTKPGRYRHSDFNIYVGPLKYAAIKAGDRSDCWFLTGLTKYGKTWEQLLDFIGEANLSTVRAKAFHSGVLPYPSHQ